MTKLCPSCGINEIYDTVNLCETCEIANRYEDRIEALTHQLDLAQQHMMTFCTPGTTIWYNSVADKTKYAAVIDEEPRYLGEHQIVVNLRDLDDNYFKKYNKKRLVAVYIICLSKR